VSSAAKPPRRGAAGAGSGSGDGPGSTTSRLDWASVVVLVALVVIGPFLGYVALAGRHHAAPTTPTPSPAHQVARGGAAWTYQIPLPGPPGSYTPPDVIATWPTASVVAYVLQDGVVGIDPATGRRTWLLTRQNLYICGASENLYRGEGILIYGVGSINSEYCPDFAAISLGSGRLLWQRAIPSQFAANLPNIQGSGPGNYAQAAVVGPWVVIPNQGGIFYCEITTACAEGHEAAPPGGSQQEEQQLLDEPSQGAALLLVSGQVNGQSAMSGSGDLEFFQIAPAASGVTVKETASVPQSAVPEGNQLVYVLWAQGPSPLVVEATATTSNATSIAPIAYTVDPQSGAVKALAASAAETDGLSPGSPTTVVDRTELVTVARFGKAESLVAFSLGTGAEIWSHAFPNLWSVDPIGFSGDGVLAIAADGDDGQTETLSLNAQSGQGTVHDLSFPTNVQISLSSMLGDPGEVDTLGWDPLTLFGNSVVVTMPYSPTPTNPAVPVAPHQLVLRIPLSN
jgi:hypothetical protein